MSKFIRETKLVLQTLMETDLPRTEYFSVFVLLCVSSTNSELTTDLDETTKDEGKAQLYTGRAFIKLLNSCSYCDEITTCNGLVVALVPSCQYGFTRC